MPPRLPIIRAALLVCTLTLWYRSLSQVVKAWCVRILNPQSLVTFSWMYRYKHTFYFISVYCHIIVFCGIIFAGRLHYLILVPHRRRNIQYECSYAPFCMIDSLIGFLLFYSLLYWIAKCLEIFLFDFGCCIYFVCIRFMKNMYISHIKYLQI